MLTATNFSIDVSHCATGEVANRVVIGKHGVVHRAQFTREVALEAFLTTP